METSTRKIRLGQDTSRKLAQWASEGWIVQPPRIVNGYLVYRLTR
ncbi:hypothetical protein ACWHA6_36485 [Streptomyces anthocyanicus]